MVEQPALARGGQEHGVRPRLVHPRLDLGLAGQVQFGAGRRQDLTALVRQAAHKRLAQQPRVAGDKDPLAAELQAHRLTKSRNTGAQSPSFFSS